MNHIASLCLCVCVCACAPLILSTLDRLKRTTDVMFGGKQVVVCGYGEVSHTLLEDISFVHTASGPIQISLQV